MRAFPLVLAVSLSALLAGCGPEVSDIGGSGTADDDDGVDPTPTPENPVITVTGSPASIDLRDAKTIDFIVRGSGGFTGTVTIDLSNLPAGVSAASTQTTVDVAAPDTDYASSFAITSDNTTVAPGTYAPHLAASAGTLTAISDPALTVNPKITLQTESAKDGDGSFSFWDTMSDASGLGTVVHLGNATMIEFVWVKNNVGNENGGAGFRIHANGTTGGLSTIAGMPCDLNGSFSHSGNCAIAPLQSNETGAGGQATFRRSLQPTNPAATTTVNFYDHVTGTAGGAATDLPGRITIMP